MAVNENVYGAVNTWANAYYQQAQLTDKNKIANFGNNTYTLADGVAKGKLLYTEGIDKSLSFCGLGTECALSHIGFIARTSNNTAAIISKNERYQTNFGFFEMINNDLRMTGDFRTNELYNFVWGNHSNFDNYNKKLRPLTKVNPHNFIFVIRVRACKSNYSEYIDVDLKTYLSTHKTTYPKIVCAYLKTYFGNADIGRLTEAGQGSPEFRIPLQIGILDEFNFEGKNLKFYSYQAMGDTPIVFGSFLSRSYIYNIPESFNMIAYTEACENYINIEYLNDTYFTSISYFDGIEEEILKTVACFGVYFTPNETIAARGALTNNDMYIGLLDNNGIGHGEYLRGADTVNAPQNEFTDMNQSGYDYTKDVDKTKYKNDTQFNTSLSLGAFTKFYQLTESQVNDLCTALYTAVNDQPQGTPIEEYNMKCFLTNNPIDCIISLKKFPLNHFPSVAGTIDDVYLGTVDSGINAPRVLSTTWVYYFDFSNSNDTGLYPVFGDDFRDKEPYTTVQINVPFCGSFEVPTTYFYKYGGVRIALMIDFVSGACTAYLIVNNDVVDSVSGACAVDLPVTGLQSATLDGNIHSAAMAEKSAQTSGTLSMVAGAISIGAGIVTGNPLLAIGGVTALVGGATSLEKNQSQIDYDLQHMQLPLKQVGAASGAIAQCGDYRCKMIIKRPVMLDYDSEVYAETIGYACLLNGHVSNFHGLTYGEIELNGVPCTADEKSYIKSLFANGVHLPTTYL